MVTHVRHGRAKWRLGFRSAVRNVGDGPLLIEGRRPSRGVSRMVASQVIQRDGAPEDVVSGVGRLRDIRSPEHEHWHLLRFDRYVLRRVGGRTRIEDRKSGFCLGDRYAVEEPLLPARPPVPVHTTRCGLERRGLLGIREGISVGFGDDYAANLEGQWLPLDALPAGRYELVHRVNADRGLREISFANSVRCHTLRPPGAARTTRTSPSTGR